LSLLAEGVPVLETYGLSIIKCPSTNSGYVTNISFIPEEAGC
jgi:hypothetical protein